MKNFRKLYSFEHENELLPRPFLKTLIKQQKNENFIRKTRPYFSLPVTFLGFLWNSI